MPDEPSALDLLWKTVPGWFVFPNRRPEQLCGFAGHPETIWRRAMLSLQIFAHGNSAAVRESEPLRLPDWCPELHLNADRTFCLGLDSIAIVDESHARQWWADLEVHLKLLSTAVRTRVWPLHSGLAHGDAGRFQSEAQLISDLVGLREDYDCALAGEPNWIADLEMTAVSRMGHRLPSARACPCGCRRKTGAAFSWTRCPRRRKVDRLILLERARRFALAEFWQICRDRGGACCRRIRDCPLLSQAEAPFDEWLFRQTLAALQR